MSFDMQAYDALISIIDVLEAEGIELGEVEPDVL